MATSGRSSFSILLVNLFKLMFTGLTMTRGLDLMERPLVGGRWRVGFRLNPYGYTTRENGASTSSGLVDSKHKDYGTTEIGDHRQIVTVGTCPACRIGALKVEHSCLCVCCFLCCFPFGFGYHRRCTNCGAFFG